MVISGYLSVFAVMQAHRRKVEKLVFDEDRMHKVQQSSFHFPEKKQYQELFALAKGYAVPVEKIPSADFGALAESGTAGGIAAIVGEREYLSPEALLDKPKPLIYLLDGIEDPYNFGYILRCFYAFGADGILIPDRNLNGADETVLRSSAGASERLEIARFSDPDSVAETLKKKGFTVLCTGQEQGSKDLSTLRLLRPLCVMIGGEKRGVNKALRNVCDATVQISYKKSMPIALSATSAASIIAYAVSKAMD